MQTNGWSLRDSIWSFWTPWSLMRRKTNEVVLYLFIIVNQVCGLRQIYRTGTGYSASNVMIILSCTSGINIKLWNCQAYEHFMKISQIPVSSLMLSGTEWEAHELKAGLFLSFLMMRFCKLRHILYKYLDFLIQNMTPTARKHELIDSEVNNAFNANHFYVNALKIRHLTLFFNLK